jgi:hypothetical protein
MSTDNVIISKDELTRKEIMLKDRLYNNFPCQLSKQTQKMLKPAEIKEEQFYQIKPEMREKALPMVDKPTSGEVLYGHMKRDKQGVKAQAKMQEGSTDDKMNAFLDEMRQ